MKTPKLLPLIAVAFSLNGFAATPSSDEVIETVGKIETTQELSDRAIGMWLFAGGDVGVNALTGANRQSLLERDGFQGTGSLIASFYIPNWVFDVGVGFHYNRLDESSNTTTTRAGLIEMAAKVRLGQRWQIGPVLDLLFGPNVSLTAYSRYRNLTGLVGLTGLYEFPIAGDNSWAIRVGPRFMTDVTLVNKQIYTATLDVHIGLPLSSQYIEKKRIVQTAYKPSQVDRVIISDIKSKPVKIHLREKEVRFSTGSDKLSGMSKNFLRELGDYLERNKSAWKSLRIIGHTDIRGSRELNNRLSRARARAVMDEIENGGVTEQKISSLGKGPSDPLDSRNNPTAWARNRRVELEFFGVNNPDQLRDDIEQIQIKTLWN